MKTGYQQIREELLVKGAPLATEGIKPFIHSLVSGEAKLFIATDLFADQSAVMLTGSDRLTKIESDIVTLTKKEHGKMVATMAKCAHLFKVPYPAIFLEHEGRSEMGWSGLLITQRPDHISMMPFFYLDCENGYKLSLPFTETQFYPDRLATAKFFSDCVHVHYLCAPMGDEELVRNCVDYEIGCIPANLAILLALNSPKITHSKECSVTTFTGRGKHKRLSTLRYTEIDLHPTVKDRIGESDRRASDRHWVRGHWKTRDTGMFWWDCHLRGVGEIVERAGYVVEREAV